MGKWKMKNSIFITIVYYTKLFCVSTFEVEFTISTSNPCYWTPCDTIGLSQVACASVCMENVACNGTLYSQSDGMCCECSFSVPGQQNYTGSFIRKTKGNVCSESLIDGIPDQSLTASTIYNPGHIPPRARMAATYVPGIYEGAWVASDSDTDKYIQAQFSSIKEVMKIVTKGKDVFNQHVTSYKVSYSVDCSTFSFVTNANTKPKRMDAKEIKNKLKAARESIRKKEFKDALKQCKAVLAEDSNHYMALVLVAVAAEGLEQYDQALKAYKRAITADDTQLLAWQGLGGFYEKNTRPEYTVDQVDVYIKLVELYEGDKEKNVDTVHKLAALVAKEGTEQSKVDQCVTLLSRTIQDVTDKAKMLELKKLQLILLQTGQRTDNMTDQVIALSKEVLDSISDFDEETEKIIKAYLAALIKAGDDKLQEICQSLYEKFPESVSTIEYLIMCHLDATMGLEDLVFTEEMEALVISLQKLCQEIPSPQLLMAEGYKALCARDWTRVLDNLSQACTMAPRLIGVYYLQAVANLRQHKCDKALSLCQTGLKAIQRKDRFLTASSTMANRAFHMQRALALCELGDAQSLKDAMEIIENELDSSNVRVMILKGMLQLQIGNLEQAKACVVGDSLHKTVLEGLIAQKEQNLELAVIKFQTAVGADPDTSSHYVHLAKALWTQPDKKKECFTALLKAAKLDPYNSAIFLNLGHYYSQEAEDKTRARKCYRKAFDLDPKSDGAGEALCDLLNEAGEEESAHNILVDVTRKASAGSAKWAWLRLGLYQVKHEDPSVAVASFQAALRSDPRDNHVWECLGEAYLARGSFTASLKAFTKSSELQPDSVYSLFQMAAIKQTLGSYQEAIEEYKLILEKSTSYVPALKGLGETYLLVAKTLLNRYFHGRARDMCELAVCNLFKAVTHRPDLSCLWKLLGDACTILHVLPEEGFKFEKPDKAVLNKEETLELGGRFYVKALKLLPECSSLWHDLGINYFYQSKCSNGDSAISLVEKAAQTLKKAIQLEPANHRHWTALGFVSCSNECFKPELAQHCFIKSIQAEANNVVAWTNLAALYLKHDNIKLAHEAFKVAQSLEPSYVSCWIGQAIIAEVVGHDEAMDLFRHTTELGNHLESALGYGHWVCAMLQSKDKQHSELYTYAIERMAAIPAASDVLARYTDRVKTNAVAYNLHGILLEQQGLYSTAAAQLKCAVTILEKMVEKSPEQQQVLCNYARVLCKKGDYIDSVAVFDRVVPLESFEDMCQLGLAAYKADNLDRSYQAYSQAFEKAGTDEDKSHVLTAIAMVLYKFGDKEKTKTTLFQSSQMANSSLAGLKALCALGLLQSDVTLATAAIQELLKLGEVGGHITEVTYLVVALHILKNDTKEVKRYIQRLLHKYPDQSKLWRLLSVILVRHFPHLGLAVQSCSESAIHLEQSKSADRQDPCILALGHLSAGNHSSTLCRDTAISIAQRAVHLYPDNPQNWCTLVSALHAEAIMVIDKERKCSLLSRESILISHILSQDDLDVKLKLWCHKQKTVCCLHGNKQTDAFESLEAMLSEFTGDPGAKQLFEVVRAVMQDDCKAVVPFAEGDCPYFTQTLVEMYLKAGLLKDVASFLDKVPQSSVRYGSLVKLAHVVFQRIMTNVEGAAELQQVFDDTISKITSIDPNCTVVPLMQGILNFTTNPRLSKHKMKTVLDTAVDGQGRLEASLARQALIYILHKDAKHAEMLETIIQEARDASDSTSINYYEKLMN